MAKAAKAPVLTLYPRTGTGTSGAKQARRDGRIPGAVYGHGTSEAVAIDAKALGELLASGGASHVVEATLGGKTESVLLREVQRDPITHRPIAANFQRVATNEAVFAAIPVAITGTASGVKDFGGVMDLVTHALEVKGPAGSLPEHIDVDVSALGVHEHITAGHIRLPNGFTLITPADTIVVSIESSRTSTEVQEAAAPAAVAEAPAAPAAE